MPLPWTAQLELVHAILVRPEVARELGGVVGVRHFENPSLGVLAETATELFAEFWQPPTLGQIRTKLEGHPMEGAVIGLFDDVMGVGIPPADWAIKEGRKHAAEIELLLLGRDMPAIVSEGRHDEPLKRGRNVLALLSPTGELTYGSGSLEEATHRQTLQGEAIATGIPTLDRHLGGGLQRGRLGCVLGVKGGGKSHTLVHLGAQALKAGQKVFYATLEMSEAETRARFDRALSGLSSEEFLAQVAEVYPTLRDAQARLTVLQATKRPMNVQAVYAVLDRMEPSRFPDLVILDYYQRLASGKAYSGDDMGKSRIVDLSDTSRTLHNEFAQGMNVAVWTAHQANRPGAIAMRSGIRCLETSDFSEAWQPAFDMDVIVSLNQTMVEEADRRARLYIAENRSGRKSVEIPVEFKKERSVLRDAAA